jgi:hypothetical protein
MSHWAEINENNIVTRVLVGNNDDINGDEGYKWLIDNLGGVWKKTSYNTKAGQHKEGGTPFRKNYAGVGFTYDESRDAFIPPKPFDSWILDEETCQWNSPVRLPDEENLYFWDEAELKWVASNV